MSTVNDRLSDIDNTLTNDNVDHKEGAPKTPLLRLRNLSKSYGQVEAVRPLDLDINRGDFFAILGPSGCGKTTLLRMIGGFIAPTTGTVEIAGTDVTALGPEKRPTNMVFQGLGLFPHMTVRQNVAYGLRIAKRQRSEIDDTVQEILALVRLQDLAERRINELSGGQQQRIALARALVMRPRVLLLDEPLAALDLKLRQAMQEELRRIHRSIGGTFVFVTHDQGEALGLANVVAVMADGVIAQVGSPEDIYLQPKTRFVSTFIGEANVLTGQRMDGTVTLQAGLHFPSAGADGPVRVVVRPEAVALEALHGNAGATLTGTLQDVVFLGPYVKHKIVLGNGEDIISHVPSLDGSSMFAVGSSLKVSWNPDAHRVIDD